MATVNGSGIPQSIRTIVTRTPIESETGGMQTETVRSEPNGRQVRTTVRQTPLGGRMGASQTETVQTSTGPEPVAPGGNPFTRSASFIDRHAGTFRNMTDVPRGVPKFLGSRQLLFITWLIAMILVASDEFNTGFIFPRPARLWYTSAVYFILFIVSQADGMVPVCNALGLGFVVTLGYENISGNSVQLFGINLSGATAAQ